MIYYITPLHLQKVNSDLNYSLGNYKITEEDNKVHQKYRTDMVEVTWR